MSVRTKLIIAVIVVVFVAQQVSWTLKYERNYNAHRASVNTYMQGR